MQMESHIEDNRLFDGHGNSKQRLRPQMSLSSDEKRLSHAERK